MNTSTLEIKQFQNPSEAPTFTGPEHLPVSIEHVNVVRNGTVGGKSTVDIVFIDENGQKFVTMITAALLKNLTQLIGE